MDRVDFTNYVPRTYVPMHMLMQSVISFHMQLLMASSNKDEAVFHWRQIWYYYDYVKENNAIVDIMKWDSRESFVELLRSEKNSESSYLLEAIDRFNLVNVE